MANNRMCKKPVIVTEDRQIKELNRIPLCSKEFKEEWLQDILEKQPNILPSGDIDSIYSQLLCVAREVEVPSGYIDNLYISAKGYVVIVETKLWKNPEATRKVVGQIIDYAKDICNWDYEKIDFVYRGYHNNRTLFSDMVEMRYQEEDDEPYFIDIVEKNLKNARFLLMIVGDGIREGTEKMMRFLNENVTMPFDFALCELEIYDMNDGRKLVVPQLTTKTRVLERTVFRMEEKICLDSNHHDENTVKKRKLIDGMDWADNADLQDVSKEQIIPFITDMEDLGFVVRVGTTDLRFDMYFENLGKRVNVLMLFGEGKTGAFQPSAFLEFLRKSGYSTAPANKLFDDLKPYLSKIQKNKPYEKERGYYFIDMTTFVIHKEELLEIFERFKLSF